MRIPRFCRFSALWVAAATLATSLSASAQEAPQPLAVVCFSGYDELMNDVDFLGGLSGQQEMSQNVEQMLLMMTQNKGLAGLDKSQPLGLIVQMQNSMPSGGVCLPVTDLKELLGVVAPFGVASEDVGDGVTQIKAQGQNLFAKTVGKWAVLSIAPPMLEGMPADPGALLNPLAREYDLAVQIHVQNVPPEYRQQGIELLSMSARQGLKKLEGEEDAAFAARQQQVEAQLQQIKQAVEDLDLVTIGLALNGGSENNAYLDVNYTAKPGSKVASALTEAFNAKTNFAGFIRPDAAMSLNFASKVSDSDMAQLQQMVAAARQKANDSIANDDSMKSEETRAAVKEGVNDFFDAAASTLEQGVVDGGAVLDLDSDSATFVAGGRIADPAKVESGLKKIVAAASKEHQQMPPVAWASKQHAGFTFHSLTVPVPEHEEQARQVFGSGLDVVVGIGPQAVYFGAGRDCQAQVEQAIDASAQSPDKPTSPAEISFALGPIMNLAKTFAEDADKEQIEMIAEMLTNQASGRDHVRITTQPIANGSRTRIEAEEGVLRAISMAAMAAQMKAAGAAQ